MPVRHPGLSCREIGRARQANKAADGFEGSRFDDWHAKPNHIVEWVSINRLSLRKSRTFPIALRKKFELTGANQ
jgi:hypothetical protein